VRGFQESCVAQPLPGGYLDAIVAESLKLPARVWQRYLREMIAADVPTEAGTIEAPTLILWRVNGIDLHVEQAGAGPPLVIVHGGWGDHTTWAPTTRLLAEHFRVVAYDRRRGSSPTPTAGWSR
jgi:hypothetical protein